MIDPTLTPVLSAFLASFLTFLGQVFVSERTAKRARDEAARQREFDAWKDGVEDLRTSILAFHSELMAIETALMDNFDRLYNGEITPLDEEDWTKAGFDQDLKNALGTLRLLGPRNLAESAASAMNALIDWGIREHLSLEDYRATVDEFIDIARAEIRKEVDSHTR